ncbi:transposase (fragment) (plasmid) [Cupriavidus taiwanensis]
MHLSRWSNHTPSYSVRRRGHRFQSCGYECHRKPEYACAQDHQTRGHLPSNEAAVNLLWLVLRNVLA